ncbi:hypothetical protein Tco_0897621 [Tanacetum coccineum]
MGPLVREFILEFLSTCKMSNTEMGLNVVDTLCFKVGGARRRITWRDFLGSVPSYVYIRDPVRRICHRMIFCNISGKGQAPEKVTGMLREGRVELGLSGGHFIGRLAAHFGLVSDEGLRGLSRQQDAVAGAPEAARDALAVDEGAPTDLAPMQAPQPPPAAPRTMPQRIARLEEEVHELRQSIMGLRREVDRSISNQGRFATWMVSCMTQLMHDIGRTYQAFDSTLVGSS